MSRQLETILGFDSNIQISWVSKPTKFYLIHPDTLLVLSKLLVLIKYLHSRIFEMWKDLR